jgi:hypothetical protein
MSSRKYHDTFGGRVRADGRVRRKKTHLMSHKMRLSLVETFVLVKPDLHAAAYGSALVCRIVVGLSRVPDYYNLAGFDVRLHFHASPSLGSSYVYGTGNGTWAVKERGCHGGIALAHQPWSVSFMNRDPCQFFRKESCPKVYVKQIVSILS